ncbi:MAG: 3-deoxy-manno-octulosonate cytidylyltransferase [Patescibacteria group bacterium]
MQNPRLKVLGIIPARLGSTRIPEKMLADISGKPLIQHTIDRTKKAHLLDALVVATDSERIANIVKPLGVPVIMTPSELPTGSDRAGAATKLFTEFTPDVIAIIWGDEPLYPAEAIDQCVALLQEDPELQVSIAADKIHDEEMWRSPSVVKVLTDLKNNVLSFSRAPVPFAHSTNSPVDLYHVIGVMVVRREFLYEFLQMSRTPLELREGVEQMRILENGVRIRVVKGDWKNLGVNMPDELEQVRTIMVARQQKGDHDAWK